MRQRSNLIILFGIAFFIVGGAIAYLVLNDDDDGGGVSDSAAGEISVLVAGADIEAGTTGDEVVEQGLLEIEQVESGNEPAGARTSPDQLENTIFATNVSEGSVILSSNLRTRSVSNVQVPEGYEGVAVQVDYVSGGAGYVAPGDRINLFGVYGNDGDAGLTVATQGAAALPRVELALTNVLVIDVDQQDESSINTADETGEDSGVGRESSGEPLTYFLALRTTDAERIVLLDQFANLYVSLTAEDAPNAADTPGFSGENVNGPVGTDSAFTPES